MFSERSTGNLKTKLCISPYNHLQVLFIFFLWFFVVFSFSYLLYFYFLVWFYRRKNYHLKNFSLTTKTTMKRSDLNIISYIGPRKHCDVVMIFCWIYLMWKYILLELYYIGLLAFLFSQNVISAIYYLYNVNIWIQCIHVKRYCLEMCLFIRGAILFIKIPLF